MLKAFLRLFGVFIALGVGLPAAAAEKGEIVIAQPFLRQQHDPTTLLVTTDFVAHSILFDGLLNLTDRGITAALAQSWEISKDGKQIDFTLRSGVVFHNGDAFTAEDVKFSFDKVVSPTSTHSYRKSLADSLERIEVLGPLKVRFVLKAPWPGFFTAARNALVGIVPKAYYEQVGAQGFQAKPVGTGPFKFVDLKAGEWTKFAANDKYWGGAPKVKAVTTVLVKETFTRYAMLKRGEADIIMDITGPLLGKMKEDKGVKIISARYSGTSAMYFNKASFPETNDVRVRTAIAHAINLKGLSNTLLKDVCEPAASVFTPNTFGHLPGMKVTSYDPALAKKLLAEAGVQPGRKITFLLHTESFGSMPNAPQTLEAIAGNLEAVGFKVERQPYDTGAYLQMVRTPQRPDIYYGPSSIPDDGSLTIDSWFLPTSPFAGGYVNVPEYVDIFKRQLNEPDTEKRRKIIQEFARLEEKNQMGPPLFWCHTPFGVSPRIVDWKPGIGSPYHMNLNTVVVKD